MWSALSIMFRGLRSSKSGKQKQRRTINAAVIAKAILRIISSRRISEENFRCNLKKQFSSRDFHLASRVPKCLVIKSNGADDWNMKLIQFPFVFSLHAAAQNEISEVFDKLHHVNGNDGPAVVTDTSDGRESPKPLVKDKPSLRKFRNVVKANSLDDWNSLAQFETFIKLEMENLAAAKNHQNSNGTMSPASPKPNGNNILKPEKHVSVRLRSQWDSFNAIHLIENYNHTPESIGEWKVFLAARMFPCRSIALFPPTIIRLLANRIY